MIFSHPIGHFEFKPWGSWETLAQSHPQTLNWQVKILTFKPNHSMSLQRHTHRQEIWVVLQGKGRFRVGDNEWELDEGHPFWIQEGELHRITNTGHKDLIILEAQLGSQIREDDLERLEDNYGRELGHVNPSESP